MRRPPTRGPQDPWTPRKITLRGDFRRVPRRPTVDGAPPDLHLHDFYAGGCRAGPPLTGRRTACISMAVTRAAIYEKVFLIFVAEGQ